MNSVITNLENLYPLFSYLKECDWRVESNRNRDYLELKVYRAPFYSLDYESLQHYISIPLEANLPIIYRDKYDYLEFNSLVNCWVYLLTGRVISYPLEYRDIKEYRLVYSKEGNLALFERSKSFIYQYSLLYEQ
jgi:hypothetical protein